MREQFSNQGDIKAVRLLKKSLDARKKDIRFILRIELSFQEPALYNPSWTFPNKLEGEAHIIGFGPAGIFAALQLLRSGIKPIVIERGKAVQDRRRDVAKLNREGELDPESNYCFGEGGAGTFSDGKLYTRSHKRGKISDILELLVMHGADPSILYEAHPHIGTNKLPAIIESLRQTILDSGGVIRFESKLEDIKISNGRIQALLINGEWVDSEHLILATGHSARDIYQLLAKRDVPIESKPFAMGFRMEHLPELH